MRRCVLLFLFAASIACPALAQLSEAQEKQRDQAYALANSGQRAEAEKILKTLLDSAPNDGGLLFQRYGYALYLDAAGEVDVPKANRLRKGARAYLVRAQQTRLDQPLIGQLLAQIATDGSVATKQYSKTPRPTGPCTRGKSPFSTGISPPPWPAMAGRALELDGTIYDAALFTGDAYFTQGNNQAAIDWFAKAIAIDPQRETAYRYSGDALVRLGEPSTGPATNISRRLWQNPMGNGLTWRTLNDWASHNQLEWVHPARGIPRATLTIKNGKVELGVDPGAGTLGVGYGVILAAWRPRRL